MSNKKPNISKEFSDWFLSQNFSLIITSGRSNCLITIGKDSTNRVSINGLEFDRTMGLFEKNNNLFLATQHQIWHFKDLFSLDSVSLETYPLIKPDENFKRFNTNIREHYSVYDQLYIPWRSYTTGDLFTHDVVVDKNDEIVFVNTQYSCLAKLDNKASFSEFWRPFFITELKPDDRCHLNCIALVDGEVRYTSCLGVANKQEGWRENRRTGGAVIDVITNTPLCENLSMPHSVRVYRDRIWVLNSGEGDFGYIENGNFKPLTFCPGYARGLAFYENFALVGLSKARHDNANTHYHGLKLEERMEDKKLIPHCGLLVINIDNGEIINSLNLKDVVGEEGEVYDLVIVPNKNNLRILYDWMTHVNRIV